MLRLKKRESQEKVKKNVLKDLCWPSCPLHQPAVNFTNILSAAITTADLKSAKKQSTQAPFFAVGICERKSCVETP